MSNNVFGLAFCLNAIEMISLDSVHVGALLLGGLFLYDIFWVSWYFSPTLLHVYTCVFSLKKEKAVLGVYICLALIYHVGSPFILISCLGVWD